MAASEGRPRYNFATEHSYDPPLEVALPAPLVAGNEQAFVTSLPQPPNGDQADQAFFYRLNSDEVVGYFNRCTHISVPLDFDDGRFLNGQGFIMCRLHGAMYELETGLRCAGPATTNLTRVLCEANETVLKIFGWRKVR